MRRHDHDRFLATLFAPKACRESLFALYAFNYELAKTREVVSEPMIGDIRLQWWRERIAELFAGNVTEHAVLRALASTHAATPLSRAYFETLIEARALDLDDTPFSTLSDLRAYAEATNAPLFYLALEAVGSPREPALLAAKSAGAAYGLIGLLRAIPFHAKQRRSFLPRDVAAEAGINEGHLFTGKVPKGLPQAVGIIAQRAAALLVEARSRQGELNAGERAALYPLIPATLSLHTLRRCGYDAFNARFQMSHPARLLALTWHHWRGRL